MVQPNTANKKKRPPKFQHLPKARAKQLKSAWIQTRKIKSKWKAERRREGIQVETPSNVSELDIPASNAPSIQTQKSDHGPQVINLHTGADAPPFKSEEHPVKASNSPTIREPIRATKMGSSQQKDRRSGRPNHQGRPSGHHGKKPSMRNRMNALLEKIQSSRETD